ncbi:hypothetical protein E2C01_050176 [Portunus trituberculatus]|uniref:Uncharacterized protein n=1 Tax=Portunus trituberculatus TaxID=210409 RepID=A0A5B7GFU0_PORTR|nr:hypothetical protein [Portunus trituberculatus]
MDSAAQTPKIRGVKGALAPLGAHDGGTVGEEAGQDWAGRGRDLITGEGRQSSHVKQVERSFRRAWNVRSCCAEAFRREMRKCGRGIREVRRISRIFETYLFKLLAIYIRMMTNELKNCSTAN